jgi:N,N-dimethylformamidase
VPAWLIGYVSDERDAAVAGASVELLSGGESVAVTSRASGAVWADVAPGAYDAVLARDGFGSKRARVELAPGRPVRWRLLADGLLGYAWPKCVVAGQRAELRIHASGPYRLELWRHGWRRELVADLGRFDGHSPDGLRQTLPDGDVAALGARWGAAEHVGDPRHTVTAPERSGLYWFQLRALDGASFSFPWVVAPARPAQPIAVLASDITWNAYNDFGGRSNYVSPTGLPEQPSVFAKHEDVWFSDPELPPWLGADCDPLSFDRPERDNQVEPDGEITDPIERRGGEHLAPAEWRLLAWLEREGFAHDLYGETQLAAGVLDLDRYRVVVLSTHPEYWTRAMYERLKRWVEGGGRLLYLGGNGIDCEVELDGAGAMRVLNGDLRRVHADPARYDSRFGLRGESAAALLGVACTMTGYETGAPYRVADAGHWALEGTGLRDGELFGHASLDRRCPGGASGHETDKRSRNAPAGVHLIAKGTNPDEGGAELVHVAGPGRGEVFSAGSISYACAIAVDDHISAITANVLRRFLGPGLTGAG